MIDDPKIVVCVSTTDIMDKLVVRRSDNGGLVNVISWDMAEVSTEGYLALCQKIGNAALRMMKDAREDVFVRHPALNPPDNPFNDPFEIARTLMERSRKEQTCAYVSAIDSLLEREADAEYMDSLAVSWTRLRPELLAKYPPR